MPEDFVQLRVPLDLAERAELMLPVLRRRRDLQWTGGMNRSTVLRLAIARGLAALEAEGADNKVSRGE